MSTCKTPKYLLAIMVLITEARLNLATLTNDYYYNSCPEAEMIVRDVVYQALRNDPTDSAGLLRMHFHDCFVQGCDGSVLIDSTTGNEAEKESPPNLSLHGFEIIDDAKKAIENVCPETVSCADILAMAARDAVAWAGGPTYNIPKGRKDGKRSKIEDTVSLPPPTLNSTMLIHMFAQNGFTAQDLVTLSGAHTLGVARCQFFKDRLKNFDPSNNIDPSLNQRYAMMLSRICSAGDNTTAAFDWSSYSFDNSYYIALQMGGGLLTSDQTLFTNVQTQGIVNDYAGNQDSFFDAYSEAMVKLGMLNAKEDDEGEVRLNCHRIN